ncbi:unnamed protein product [Wuchereria bancrofti]|uniref:Uncharacterized protein n=1 Tax=Wuchereria bancrofti TaxID=6293 RepID=A0A3P7FSK9_WUCBA|nr:unnamed protein product [Wuchereria bancrofti]
MIHTNEPFPSNHIFAVLNCTFVALCVHNSINQLEEGRRLFGDQDMPILLNPDKVDALRVVGYGFIRAVDLEQRIFFISTPLELSDLQEVNVLARGLNIDLPQFFLVSQGRSAIPYVVRERSSSFHTELFRELKIKSVFHRKRFLRMQSQFMVKKPMYEPMHHVVNI